MFQAWLQSHLGCPTSFSFVASWKRTSSAHVCSVDIGTRSEPNRPLKRFQLFFGCNTYNFITNYLSVVPLFQNLFETKGLIKPAFGTNKNNSFFLLNVFRGVKENVAINHLPFPPLIYFF